MRTRIERCEALSPSLGGDVLDAMHGGGTNETTKRWLREDYLPRHNARFARLPAVAESAFVPSPDRAALVEALCIQEECVVERDNIMTSRKLKLQLPDSPLRHHWVKARVRIHQYPDGTLALFHGPSCFARYDGRGRPRPASRSPVMTDRPPLPDPTRGFWGSGRCPCSGWSADKSDEV